MPDQSGYYDESASAAPSAAPQTGAEESSTALLPKQFVCGGDPKPGDRCEVEIVRVHGDQVEVKCCGSDAENTAEESAPAEEPETATAPGGMSDAYA